MKQLVMLVAAGLMALVLTACEEKPKQPEATQTTTTTQPADEASKPAEATTTTTTQPQE
jgi:uncharacterized lipoprotein YbaY